MDKISIITVTYNCEKCIEGTIKSVLSQDYPNIEYIVIDGNSNDGTKVVINKYIDRIATYVSEPDKGIYDAMNKGLKLATGDWVFFLNAGDNFHSCDTLSSIPFEKNTKATEICGIIGNILLKRNGRTEEWHNKSEFFFENTKRLKPMGFSHQGVFTKTILAKEIGFDMSFKLCADYNMMYQLHNKGYKFAIIDTIISEILAGEGASISNLSLQFKEEARICNCENSIYFKLVYYWRIMRRTIKTLFKK